MNTFSHVISKYFVSKLEQNQYCSDEKKILLTYGAEVALESLWKSIAYTLWGFMIHRGFEMLLAMLDFCSIRKFAGGYHAKTPEGCFFCGFVGLNIAVLLPIVLRPHKVCVIVLGVVLNILYRLFSSDETNQYLTFVVLNIFLFISVLFDDYWGAIILYSSIFEIITLIIIFRN